MLDPWAGNKKIRAYRRLFLDEHGRLKPEAETVLNDLFEFARFFKNVPADALALAVVEGSRQMLRHILKRTGTAETEMKRQIKGDLYDDDE